MKLVVVLINAIFGGCVISSWVPLMLGASGIAVNNQRFDLKPVLAMVHHFARAVS